MPKTVLFIPGFQEDLSSRDYTAVLECFSKAGYIPQFVAVHWKYRTITEWSREVADIYAQYNPSTTVLAGFSFGAIIALRVAATRPPTELWLFSISPYFAEDLPHAKTAWLREIGQRRVRAFSQITSKLLASKIPCKTLIFLGEKEAKKHPQLKRRSEELRDSLAQSHLIAVPHTGHTVESKEYLNAIKEANVLV